VGLHHRALRAMNVARITARSNKELKLTKPGQLRSFAA
jgi:hypothetical protein